MKTSPEGVLEIMEHEGVVLGPYLDSVKVWTYGVGHTKGAGFPHPEALPKVDTRRWSDRQVEEELHKIINLFEKDLKKYEDRVKQAIKVPLKQHQFDALVSFDFNTGGIFKAQLTQQINRGDMSGNGFMGWVRPKEIVKRRTAEQRLFRTGEYDHNGDAIALWDTTVAGKPVFRKRVSGKDLGRYFKAPVVNTNTTDDVGFIGWLKRLLKALRLYN